MRVQKRTIMFFLLINRNHRKISWEYPIWKRVIHTIGQCNRYNILTMMNQTQWTDTKFNIVHFIRAHHSVYGEAVAAACPTFPFGIHTDSWYRNVKPAIVSVISIPFPASVNKFRLTYTDDQHNLL